MKIKQYEDDLRNLSAIYKNLDDKNAQLMKSVSHKDEKIAALVDELKMCHDKLKSKANEVKIGFLLINISLFFLIRIFSLSWLDV